MNVYFPPLIFHSAEKLLGASFLSTQDTNLNEKFSCCLSPHFDPKAIGIRSNFKTVMYGRLVDKTEVNSRFGFYLPSIVGFACLDIVKFTLSEQSW